MRIVLLMCAVALLAGTARAQRVPDSACAETPVVTDAPPRDPNADPFGTGPWNVNPDRTIWVQPSFSVWREGLNQKVMWIRPAGTELHVIAERLDGPSMPVTATVPCCYRTGFQVGSVTFPAAGCWKVTATAGDHVLEFITRVRPRP
jgi:hypothetical protein